jgi:hypothetical protein
MTRIDQFPEQPTSGIVADNDRQQLGREPQIIA